MYQSSPKTNAKYKKSNTQRNLEYCYKMQTVVCFLTNVWPFESLHWTFGNLKHWTLLLVYTVQYTKKLQQHKNFLVHFERQQWKQNRADHNALTLQTNKSEIFLRKL